MKTLLFIVTIFLASNVKAQDYLLITKSGDSIKAYNPVKTNKTDIFYRDANNKTFKLSKNDLVEKVDLAKANVDGSITSKFYVKPDESKGFEIPVIDKLKDEMIEVVYSEEKADYIIECKDYYKGGGAAQATLIIFDKNGNVVGETDKSKGNLNAFNGYRNPRASAIQKAADEYLIPLIIKLGL